MIGKIHRHSQSLQSSFCTAAFAANSSVECLIMSDLLCAIMLMRSVTLKLKNSFRLASSHRLSSAVSMKHSQRLSYRQHLRGLLLQQCMHSPELLANVLLLAFDV